MNELSKIGDSLTNEWLSRLVLREKKKHFFASGAGFYFYILWMKIDVAKKTYDKLFLQVFKGDT